MNVQVQLEKGRLLPLSCLILSPPPTVPMDRAAHERQWADCGEREERRTDLVGILLHQLPNFAGASVRRLDDQPAGVVLLRGLR